MSYVAKTGGFRPVKYLNGAPWNGQARPYVIPAADGTATFVGDLVRLETTGDSVTGLPTCIAAVAGAAVCGVIVGMEPSQGTALGGDFLFGGAVNLDTPVFRAASTRRVVWVADDPNLLFEAEEDLVTTPLTFAAVNQNIDFVATAGSATTGLSGFVVDSNTNSNTATVPLKIMGLIRRGDNDFHSAGNASSSVVFNNPRWLIKINNHQLGSSTGTAGV